MRNEFTANCQQYTSNACKFDVIGDNNRTRSTVLNSTTWRPCNVWIAYTRPSGLSWGSPSATLTFIYIYTQKLKALKRTWSRWFINRVSLSGQAWIIAHFQLWRLTSKRLETYTFKSTVSDSYWEHFMCQLTTKNDKPSSHHTRTSFTLQQKSKIIYYTYASITLSLSL